MEKGDNKSPKSKTPTLKYIGPEVDRGFSLPNGQVVHPDQVTIQSLKGVHSALKKYFEVK